MSAMEEKSEIIKLFKKLTKGRNIGGILDLLKDRWVRAGVIIMAGTLLVLTFIIFPMKRKASAIKNLLGEERYELIDRIASLKKTIDQYSAQLPKNRDMNWFIDKAVEAAHKTGITLSAIEPGPSAGFDQYEHISILVRTECTYIELIDFLEKLESLVPSAAITSCKMKNVGEKAEVAMGLSALVLHGPEEEGLSEGETEEEEGVQKEETEESEEAVPAQKGE